MKNIILEKKFDLELSFIRNTIIDYMYKKEKLDDSDINFLSELGLENVSKERIDEIYNNGLKTILVKIGDILKEPFLSLEAKNKKRNKEIEENLIKLNDKLKSAKDIDEEEFNNIELEFVSKKFLFKHLPDILHMIQSRFNEIIKEKNTLIKNAKEMEWNDFKKYCLELDYKYDEGHTPIDKESIYQLDRELRVITTKIKKSQQGNNKKNTFKNLGYSYKDIFKLIEEITSSLKRNSSREELVKFLKEEGLIYNDIDVEILEHNKETFDWVFRVLMIYIEIYFSTFFNLVIIMESVSEDIEKCL
jgi:hypothetical protein